MGDTATRHGPRRLLGAFRAARPPWWALALARPFTRHFQGGPPALVGAGPRAAARIVTISPPRRICWRVAGGCVARGPRLGQPDTA